jgi:hypothetical protein
MAAYKGVVATADYTFDKTAKTITFSANYTGIALSDIMYITNVKSATATVIYDPSNAALGGSLSGLVLTLAYDTSAMLSADPLQIIIAMGTLAAKVDASGVTLTVGSHAVTNAGTFAVQATPVTQADTFMLGGVNIKEINAVAPLMGSGVMGTGSLRVTIASDNDPIIAKQATAANLNATVVGTGTFVVQATLAAETTKIIGTVNIAASQAIIASNAGTFAVQESGGALTSLQLIDDTVYGDDATRSKSLLIGAVLDDASTVAITENNAGYLRMSSRRALLVEGVASGTALNASLAAETTKVIGTINLSAAQTLATLTSITNVVHVDDNSGTLTVDAPVGTPLFARLSDGAAALIGQKAMTASLPVVLASDQASIPVAATLTAETTKVIGVVRNADGAGNLFTSNSTTYTAKFAQDANLLGTLGTAFTTAGKVDVKAADGDIFVRQATASNLNMTEASAANILTKLTAGAASMVKLEDVAAADADAGVPAMAVRKATPANTSNADGDYEMLQMSSGRLWVDPSGVTLTVGSHAVTNAGTFAVQATLASETTKVIGTINISASQSVFAVGDIANAASDSGNPVKIGFVAKTANPTAVTDGQRVNAIADKLGKQVTIHALRELVVDGNVTLSASVVETTLISAGAAGVFHDLCYVTIANTSATDARIDFRDATAGTVRFSILAKAGQTTGFARPRSDGVKQTTAANNWTVQSSASVTDIRIFAEVVKNL